MFQVAKTTKPTNHQTNIHCFAWREIETSEEKKARYYQNFNIYGTFAIKGVLWGYIVTII